MDTETIKEITKITLADIGIDATENHYLIALNYYEQNGNLALADYIVSASWQNNQNEELESDSGSESENEFEAINEVESLNQVITNTLHNFISNFPQSEMLNTSSFLNSLLNPNLNPQPVLSLSTFNSNQQAYNLNANLNVNLSEQFVDVKRILTKDEIKNLQIVFINEKNKSKYDVCPICFDHFIKTDIVKVLPCNHFYHRRCIDYQLKKQSHLCPLCKIPIAEGIIINN